MPTFPLFARRAEEAARNAELLAQLARESTGPTAREERERHIHERAQRRFEFPTTVDLRGIPATGRGVSGTIRGTQPETEATRRT